MGTAPHLGRLDSLTGLRWWAAFAVFCFHMNNLAPLPISSLFRYGNYGVTFFFLLSGFVLTWSARSDTRVSTFYWRRFARIYPAHLVALVLAIPVFYSFAPDPAETWVKPVSIGVLLLSVLLVQGWWRDPSILFSGNPAAWTLTCEAFFYALHPFINRVLAPLRTRGALYFTGAVFAVALVYRVAVVVWPNGWFAVAPWPIVRLTEFAIGMGLAKAVLSGWRFRVPVPVLFALSVSPIAAYEVLRRLSPEGIATRLVGAFQPEMILLLLALTLVAVAVRDIKGSRSLLRSRPLVFLGDVSFAFYLVHATIVYALRSIVGIQPTGWSGLSWWLLAGTLALAGAIALHLLVEKPVERRLRSWWDSRDGARRSSSRQDVLKEG